MNLPDPPPQSKDWTKEQWDEFLMLVFPLALMQKGALK
jgi:hypothetical protein